jgi:RND family efflux transporter MFP subunit
MNATPCRVRLAAVSCLLLVGLGGCNHSTAPTEAAKPEKPRNETDLSRTTVSRAAQQSLDLQTTKVRVESIQEYRTLTGWIIAQPGAEVPVTAPVAGYVRAPTAPAPLPTAGLPVRQGQELFRLEPVLTALEQTQVAALKRGLEQELTKAKDAAAKDKNELDRILKLVKQGVKFERDVELARTQYQASEEDARAADGKLKAIGFLNSDKGETRLAEKTLEAPRGGIALTVFVSPGQYVPSAAPLVTIADLSKPWVRVPVPEYDLPHLDRSQAALVKVFPAGSARSKTQPNGAQLQLQAEPVALVPQVDPIKHTADLVYDLKLPVKSAPLAKDQMVEVSVPIGKRSEQSIVPYSAVYFDAHQGAWVYLDRTPKDADTCVYERVQVDLGVSLGNDVAVRGALKAGDMVVSDGAAKLFSREFYRPPVVVPEAPKK